MLELMGRQAELIRDALRQVRKEGERHHRKESKN